MTMLKGHHSFLDLFPVPEFMLMGTTGISINTDAVRIVEAGRGRKSGGVEVVNLETLPIPSGTIVNGSIQDPNSLGEVLKKVVKKNGAYMHATLPDEKGYIFTSVIDKVPFEGLRDAVAFIIEENVPLTLDKSIFDFEIIGETEGKSEIKVAVSVVSYEVVSTYTEALKSAGITPLSFTLESQAVSRALIPNGDNRALLVIYEGVDKTGLYIVQDGVVQFSTTALSDDNVQSEAHRALSFWNSRLDKHGNLEKKVEEVIISGAKARDENFCKGVTAEFGIPCTTGDVWKNVSSPDLHKSNMHINDSFAYAPALGLALPKVVKDYV